MSQLLNSGFSWDERIMHCKEMVVRLSQQLELDPDNYEVEERLDYFKSIVENYKENNES